MMSAGVGTSQWVKSTQLKMTACRQICSLDNDLMPEDWTVCPRALLSVKYEIKGMFV